MANVTLQWTIPSTRVDGTPFTLSDVDNVKIYRSGSLISTNSTVVGPSNHYTDTDVPSGSWDYTVTTTLKGAAESSHSNVAHVDIAIVQPTPSSASAVSDLSATVS